MQPRERSSPCGAVTDGGQALALGLGFLHGSVEAAAAGAEQPGPAWPPVLKAEELPTDTDEEKKKTRLGCDNDNDDGGVRRGSVASSYAPWRPRLRRRLSASQPTRQHRRPIRVRPPRAPVPVSVTHTRVRVVIDLLNGTREDLLRYADDDVLVPVLRRCAHSMLRKILAVDD